MAPLMVPSALRSLLIVKLSSIGDVVHALPVATALRRRYPGLRISWAVEDWVAPLLLGHPAVDRTVVFPSMRWSRAGFAWARSFARAVRDLTSEPYDVSLDLQGLLKSSTVALLSRAALRLGTWYQREGARFVSRPVPNRAERVHVVDDYLQCAEFLGAPPRPVIFGLPVQSEAATSIARKLGALRVRPERPLLVINPSASLQRRTWRIKEWGRVVDGLAAFGEVVLVGSADQVRRHAQVARLAARRVYDLTGCTLAELVALLDRCTVHVAPDTGSAHIAAALGRPVVGLYGPTPPWRNAPYGCEEFAVYRDGSCGTSCPRVCLRGGRCLRAVTPDELIHQTQRALMRAADLTAKAAVGVCS